MSTLHLDRSLYTRHAFMGCGQGSTLDGVCPEERACGLCKKCYMHRKVAFLSAEDCVYETPKLFLALFYPDSQPSVLPSASYHLLVQGYSAVLAQMRAVATLDMPWESGTPESRVRFKAYFDAAFVEYRDVMRAAYELEDEEVKRQIILKTYQTCLARCLVAMFAEDFDRAYPAFAELMQVHKNLHRGLGGISDIKAPKPTFKLLIDNE